MHITCRSSIYMVLACGTMALISACGENNNPAKLYSVPEGTKVTGKYIVVLKDNFESLSQNFLQDIKVENKYANVFPGFSTYMQPEQLNSMLKNPEVKAIYEVGKRRLFSAQANPTWGIDRLDQASSAMNGSYKYVAAGKGVTAYVIDTGIKIDHSEFQGRAIFGADVTADKGTPRENIDGVGHGTHVAGTIASSSYGVAKEASLVAVKVFSTAGGESPDDIVIAGIDFAIGHHKQNRGPAVINMSLGGEKSPVLDEAIKHAVAEGIITVVAAGNENSDACNVSPASEPVAITVASMSSGDSKSYFSNWGKCVDIIAPGSGITSTWNNGRTKTIDGTSMASPHVAGVAALYLSVNPLQTPAEVQAFLIDNSIKGVASGFSSDTPNRIVNTLWNLPELKPGEAWSEVYYAYAQPEQIIIHPTDKGFAAIAGNKISAKLEPAHWWNWGNCDLYLKRINADGTSEIVASSEESGLYENIDFSVQEAGKYVLEVKGISGGNYALTTDLK